MKFKVSSSKISEQLQNVSKVIAPKNALAILDDVLFSLEGNELSLIASDGETTIRTAIEVEDVQGNGSVAFGAKIMLDTLKGFTAEVPLVFDIDESNFSLRMTSPNGEYSAVGVSGDNYPKIALDADADSHSFSIQASLLVEAINKTAFAAGNDELRPVMNGIFFDLNAEHVVMVATDAHRLVRYTNNTLHVEQPISFILPKKPANLIKGIFGKEDPEVTIFFGSKNARFAFNNTVIVCRQVEGRYPNYNAVIPQNNTNTITVDRETILAACRRVAIYANNGSMLIRLALKENQITISSQDIDFSTAAEETIPCSYNGPEMAIGFKAPFLIQLIDAIPSEEVILRLADPARAGLILPVEQEADTELLMLIMPMLLND